MKPRLLILALALPTALFGQTENSSETKINIQFYTPDIVRVTKTPANSAGAQPSLVVILEPQNVAVKQSQSGGVTTYQSAKLKVTVDNNGKVSFAGIKGGKLLDEGSFSFSPITSGTDKGSFKISQSFKLAANETVYGVGTIQNGKLERNNTETLIEQSNLGQRSHGSDHIDIALIKLAESAMSRSVCAINRLNLITLKNAPDIVLMHGDKPRQRHGQIIAQPQIALSRCGFRASHQNLEQQLVAFLAIFPHQRFDIFDRRRLYRREAMFLINAANRIQHALALPHLGWQKISCPLGYCRFYRWHSLL